jgi:hopanoid biosynthesis associated radical SAM protein HpnH
LRFPFVLYKVMIKHLIKQNLAGNKRFPFVLMLEPTLRCNLDCIGCGRIAEYHANPIPDLTVEQCLQGVAECGAPIVSVCGGEPLAYKHTPDLIEQLLFQKKYVYLCTNALLLHRYWEKIPPHPYLALSIHLDGMENGHDWAVQKPGTFNTVSEHIDEAIARGYRVIINTTVYNGSNTDEILQLFDYLHKKGVHGMLVSAAYPQEGEKSAASLNNEQTATLFKTLFNKNGTLHKYPFENSPMYIDFLQGKRDLACTPWGSPNLSPRGWKGPCYVLTDGYYDTFQELLAKTNWDQLGPGKDPRCTHCKIHSGFEPTIARGEGCTLKDHLQMLKWNLF